jgi:hypothetical protein
MNNAIPAASKRVYVPTSRVRKKAEPRPVLPDDLARQRAAAAMRSVHWTGHAPVEVLAPRLEPIAPTMTARNAFAQMPWSGRPVLDPTPVQSVKSAKSILGQFKWE